MGNSFDILGGAGGNAQNLIVSQSFTVDVGPDASAAPEPSEWAAILFSGLSIAGLLLKARPRGRLRDGRLSEDTIGFKLRDDKQDER